MRTTWPSETPRVSLSSNAGDVSSGIWILTSLIHTNSLAIPGAKDWSFLRFTRTVGTSKNSSPISSILFVTCLSTRSTPCTILQNWTIHLQTSRKPHPTLCLWLVVLPTLISIEIAYLRLIRRPLVTARPNETRLLHSLLRSQAQLLMIFTFYLSINWRTPIVPAIRPMAVWSACRS